MRRLAAVVLIALALPAAAGSSTTAASGLRGLVTRGPITPVCSAESPCEAPAAHVTLTFTKGATTRSVTTGADGRYKIRLAAGSWRLQVGRGGLRYAPQAVLVRAGVVRTQNVSIDTGIR